MATYTCPDGHTSQSGDYCDVCGLPIQGAGAGAAGSAAGSSAPVPSPLPPPLPTPSAPAGRSPAAGPSTSGLSLDAPRTATRTCPNCSTDNPADALFCENCGYDFTTGQLPRPLGPPDPGSIQGVPPPAAPDGTVEWVAEVWIDPDWYTAQGVTDPLPSAGAPAVVPLAERTVLVGRTSASRNIHPQIDCSADNGVSRRHAQLSTDGQRWWVEDLQSSNGTYVGGAGERLPTTPVTPGQRVELADDDRVYVGAWTRIVVRRAAPGEV
jgi:hypothetical protein